MFKDIKDEAGAIDVQNKLNEFIVLHNEFDYQKLNRVAGVDLAYWNESDIEYAVCCIVVVDYNTNTVLEKAHTVSRIEFPYIPGCLAFRELPLVLETASKLTDEPDLYIFDALHIIPEGMDIPELNEARAIMNRYLVDLNSER